MVAFTAAEKMSGDFVAGTLFAPRLFKGLLLPLAILQGLEGAEPLFFGLPLLAPGGQLGLGMRNDTILL